MFQPIVCLIATDVSQELTTVMLSTLMMEAVKSSELSVKCNCVVISGIHIPDVSLMSPSSGLIYAVIHSYISQIVASLQVSRKNTLCAFLISSMTDYGNLEFEVVL